MTCVERLGKVASQALDGVMFHTDLTDLFDFLSLKGFYKWQKHQLDEELCNLNYIKHYAFKKHHMFLTVELSDDVPEVIPAAWMNHSALEATSADIATTLKASLTTYWEYEQKVAKEYKALAEEAEGTDKDMICELHKEVCEEITKIEQMIMKLQSTNYNSLHIQLLSNELCEKFK